MAEKSTSSTRWRRVGLALWPLLALTLWGIHLYPIRFAGVRLVMVALVLALWLGAVLLAWPVRAARLGALALSALLLLALLAPGRRDPAGLRAAYVAAMEGYTGTPYVWGGETSRGIDCSGLIRMGLVDAGLRRGLRTVNPALLRGALGLWWDDCSARALGEEYHRRTQFLFRAPSINAADASRMRPGDFAVTASGVHTLAYLGNHTWIEADPSLPRGDSVIQVHVPSDNAWFHQPVRIMRWRALEP